MASTPFDGSTECTTASSDELQTVVFRLADEAYGIDIFRVNEIIRLREITSIPKTDAHVRGLVNLRGKTIPVLDLRARFNLQQGEETENTRIIVVESDNGNVGIVVDAVTEVMTLQSDQIEDTPSLVTDVDNDFVRGVARRNESLITLLDLDKALAA
ncbi:MAG: purine-binding chemotaxis protein CheW [Armatimonadetes bacterium]|nr:purine-binding chemotaxis protein CheW [Armatimonadota bacterium]